MEREKAIVGFIGAGGIARSHAFAISSLQYYYDDTPEIQKEAVCSSTEKSRVSFASRFGFTRAIAIKDFISDKGIDTVFILGPNNVHFEHLKSVFGMAALKRVYLEKPVCSNSREEEAIAQLISERPEIKIQVGFQFLFSPAVREALLFWKAGFLGKPVHFDTKYFHGDYLKKEYRDKRASRLTPAPDGGAMADLGSHAISMLIAFLGNKLQITSALQSGSFPDVTPDSDLFSLISLYDQTSGSAGSLSASRISSGTGDSLSIELYAEKGTLKYSSLTPDYFESYLEETGLWSRHITGSNYRPVTSFPSGHVPPGWLRAMIHAHYVFLNDGIKEPFIPMIEHGLDVQRLVRQTAEHLGMFRQKTRFK